MKTITLLRKSVKPLKLSQTLISYQLDLEITSANGITKDLFVKQRYTKYDGTFVDDFVAVASPATIADYDVGSPAAGSVFYRTNTISIISTDPTFLEEAFENILGELQLLVDQAEVLDSIQADGVYSITSGSIDVNLAEMHTHYRIPLTAQPAGTNNVFVDPADSQIKHSVTNENADLAGWLNHNPASEPMGYYFQYNIPKDTGVGAIWPINASTISYAHIERNGVTVPDVYIDSTGIYWKSNLSGQIPWPDSYKNAETPWEDPADRIVLVLDAIN